MKMENKNKKKIEIKLIRLSTSQFANIDKDCLVDKINEIIDYLNDMRK